MEWIFHHLAQNSIEGRLWALSSMLFIAGTGFFPIPLDMFLAALGVMIGRGSMPYLQTLLVCLFMILFCDTAAFELGKLFGKWVLGNPWITKRFGKHRIESIQNRLKQSELKVVRTLRFNVILKPYFILFSSALGVSRRKFYSIHFLITVIYLPLLLGGMAWLSQRVQIHDWQIVVTFWTLWGISVLIPIKRKAFNNKL